MKYDGLDHYVYLLCDPDTLTPMYVGQTNNPDHRLRQHIADVAVKNQIHTPKHKWIKYLLDNGKLPVMQIVETFIYPCDKRQVNLLESRLIKVLGTLNVNSRSIADRTG